MEGEKTPTNDIGVFRFATRDPSLGLERSGAGAFDGGFPVFVLDEGVELSGAEVVVCFWLVLVAWSSGDDGVGSGGGCDVDSGWSR